MKDSEFLMICGGEGRIYLALSSDGKLYRREEGKEWSTIDFNEDYKGYYPACRFTALAATEADFVAAAQAEDGLPYVFRTVRGGVWDMVNLTGGTALSGYVRASGKVNEVLYDNVTKQVFLLCDNGELVTLPDCPKCVRIGRVSTKALIQGRIVDKKIILQTEEGETLKISLQEAMQIRISVSYAEERLKREGQLIDLRRVETEELPELLRTLPADTFLAFICNYGIRSDEAARYARKLGFTQAFSLGGAKTLFHET